MAEMAEKWLATADTAIPSIPSAGAVSRFGRIGGPSIPPLREQFWALGFHTGLLWSGQVSSLVIRCYSNVVSKSDTLLHGLP